MLVVMYVRVLPEMVQALAEGHPAAQGMTDNSSSLPKLWPAGNRTATRWMWYNGSQRSIRELRWTETTQE